MITAITMYTLSTAIHVVFVVSFLAPAGAGSVLGPMTRANPEHALFSLRVTKKIYETLTFPGLFVVWGTGFYQMSDGGFGGDDVWLSISLALFALMTLTVLAIQYPSVKTAIAELEAKTEPGPPSEKAQASLKKLGIAGPMQGLGLLTVTFLMVAQPF